jgi:hypothetical protein
VRPFTKTIPAPVTEWGNGELPIKNDTVQGFAMMALMLVLIFGAIFAFGVQ